MNVDLSRSRRRGASGIVLACAVALVVSACGGSSSSSSSTASAKASSTPPAGVTGASGASARRQALQQCLKKYGVTLPNGGGFGGGFGGRFGGRFGASGASGFRGRFGATGASGFRRRFGATGASGFPGGRFGGPNSKFATALQKCGGFGRGGFAGGGPGGVPGGAPGTAAGGSGGGGFSASSATDRAEVTQFAACVRKNGFDLPNPDFSGSSVFPRADESNPKFVSASAKCESILKFASTSSG